MKLDLWTAAAGLTAALLLFQGSRAFGADELKPQQQRMRACNSKADAKGLTAGERNHFMRACLKGANGNGHQLSAHQRRNQECARKAREQALQGAERRGFMTECEKPPAAQTVADREKMKACERRAKDRRLDGEETRNYLNGCRSGAAAAGG